MPVKISISARRFCVSCSLSLVLFFLSCATFLGPDDIRQAEAHYKLGYSYLNNNQLTEAYVEFQKALQFNPRHKESLNYLGYISTRFKNYDKAISYYKQAIAADPDYAEAMNNLGVAYLDIEKWDEAIKYFEVALKNPIYLTPERAYSNMGYAYYKKGDYQNAGQALREALMRNPVFYIANYYLGLVYVKLGNDESAIEEFKKAVGLMPEYMDAHWGLANAYLRSGSRDNALEHFKIIAAKDADIKRSQEALEYIELLK